jgi:hypothetical protein
MRIVSILMIVGAGLLGLAACSDDSTGGSGGSGGNGTAGSGGSSGTAGGGGGSAGGSPGAGYCAKGCAMPADCCAPGSMGCPGPYPNNWTCDSGVCGGPQCSTDDDCTFGGVLMGYKCLTEGGLKICAKDCAADADCTMPLTCIGSDDNGAKYCSAEPMGGGCKTDADCGGYGKCDVATGACGCTADADCTAMGVDKCVQ